MAASFQDLVAQTVAAKDSIKKYDESKREFKKSGKSDWLKQNKGVNLRAQRDVELRQDDLARLSHDQIKANMEKKSRQYEQMRRGDYSGITDAQQAELPFDPEARHRSPFEDNEDPDDGKRESASKKEEDIMIECTDEYGRSRRVPKSEAPSEYIPKPLFRHDEDDGDEGEYVEGLAAAHHFASYEPSAERLASIKESLKEEPLVQHFDPNQEIRNRGAAYIKLGQTEEERQRNLAALREARQETIKNRTEAGAVDVKPGQEGMKTDDKPHNNALEKRKSELEARRAQIKEKKQKREADQFLSGVLKG